ncbi:uncharacterized protein N7482_010522 [Penicillium canariense]|uniref:Uncharacterized protein n=1 Tax=Penicillium canariense TaxID=189055 RepID=A0A9W9HM87_9EURO|nr:uncharacterized protein N7482_010522 [Penicillium canariense]KAJ5151270.1 hypothetical protein N7482_010522 [Penicillium canariense]
MPSAPKGGSEQPPDKPARSGKDSRKPRKEKRQLVRWDGDLDTLLLLTVQSACNLTGVKIPWEKVAELMGEKFTEGAIVQHLSKLRLRREAANQRVPPPLRRSVTAAAASSKGTPKAAKKDTHKPRGPTADDDSSDDLDAQEEDESDPEYIQNKKTHKFRKFSIVSPKKRQASTQKPKAEGDDDDDLMCGGAPFLRLKQSELKSDHSNSDDEDYGDEDDDEEEAADNGDVDDSEFSSGTKMKVEQPSPIPWRSRVVKLPMGRRLDEKALREIRRMAEPSPPPTDLMPPSALMPPSSGSQGRSVRTNEPALMYGTPDTWYSDTAAIGQQLHHYPFTPGYSTTHPNPIQSNIDPLLLGSDMQGSYPWSVGGLYGPQYPARAGPPLSRTMPQPWGPEYNTGGINATTMDWALNPTNFQEGDGRENKGSHQQQDGMEEY